MPDSQIRPLVYAAAPTGFAADGSLDLAASRRILEFTAASGVDGAFVMGTTGEFPALARDERRALAEVAVEVCAGRRLIVHAGADSAYEVRGLIADARAAGASAVAVVTPYYLRASDDAILTYFRHAAQAADGLDVYAYLFAARTGNPVSPEVFARLMAIEGVVGAKISGETPGRIGEYRAAVGDEVVILTGEDRDLVGACVHGGNGVVSAVSSAFPAPYVAVADAIAAGDTDALARLQPALDAATAAVAANPERLRAALTLRGVDAGTSRMALDPVDDAARDLLRDVIERVG